MRFRNGLQTGRYLVGGWYVIRVGQPLLFAVQPEDREGVDRCTATLAAAMGRLATEASALLDLLEGREGAAAIERLELRASS
jgi:hypothetical protein